MTLPSRRSSRLLVVSAIVCAGGLATACGEVPAGNPYDPEGTGPKAPGRITGTVLVQGRSSQEGWAVAIIDELDVDVDDSTTDADGNFTTAEIPVGQYTVRVEVPVENVPIEEGG